jgi:hypothetical protein
MRLLTKKDQEINKAQTRVAEARSRLHSLAPLGNRRAPEYLQAERELDEAQAALTEAFGLPEEFECAFCQTKWDGKGRVVISLIHATIHSEEDGRVIEEYEYSTGNQRHLVLCPDCAAPLTRDVSEPAEPKAKDFSTPGSQRARTPTRAMAEYFNRR